MPELMIQKIIEIGIWDLQNNPDKMDYIFNTYNMDEFSVYGQDYIEEIKKWFTSTDIPVIQSWSFNPERIPCISVHLSSEVEDIDKAAMGDHWGKSVDEFTDVGVGVFNVTLSIGIHASRNGNFVLWLYYILHHIFFTYKLFIEKMGFQLHTFSGGDYNHDERYLANNIWSRWINFNCTIQNCWTSMNEQEYNVILSTYLDRKNGDDPLLIFKQQLDQEFINIKDTPPVGPGMIR